MVAETRFWQKELQEQTERHLERIRDLVAQLWAWAPLPQVYRDGGEAVEELRGAPQHLESVDKPCEGLCRLEEGEKPGERLLLQEEVEEKLPEVEKSLREGLLQPGAVEETLQPEGDEARQGPWPLEGQKSPHLEVQEVCKGSFQLGTVEQPLQPDVEEVNEGPHQLEAVMIITHLISICDNCKCPESGQTEEPTAAHHLRGFAPLIIHQEK
ncbi:uncharacterized protein LOC116335005 [Oreochromis aureus]|uniref:uncharacterized protein LOC116335005 n=1 Tax=Oreochromis aureus TaxID=47969 RepID=UPI0012BCA74B|nr:uncharacterized protein LOC116335005 [Oreochromis aureus]